MLVCSLQANLRMLFPVIWDHEISSTSSMTTIAALIEEVKKCFNDGHDMFVWCLHELAELLWVQVPETITELISRNTVLSSY